MTQLFSGLNFYFAIEKDDEDIINNWDNYKII
jgi:hypothetical protein